MRLVKIIKDLNNLDIKAYGEPNGPPASGFISEILGANYYNGREASFITSRLCGMELSIEENRIIRTMEDGSYFEIMHYTPPELIPYVKCNMIHTTTNVEVSDTYESYGKTTYDIEKKFFLRFVFDGPDDLGLIWKLSI